MIEPVTDWECVACEGRFYAPAKSKPTFCPFGDSDRCPDLVSHGQRYVHEQRAIKGVMA